MQWAVFSVGRLHIAIQIIQCFRNAKLGHLDNVSDQDSATPIQNTSTSTEIVKKNVLISFHCP